VSSLDDIVAAIVYITAISNDETMCAYKLFVNGKLVSVGPGRPEAPIFGGNGTFMRNPYTTLDVTSAVLDQDAITDDDKILLAIAGVYRPEPGSTNQSFPSIMSPSVMMQLVLRSSSGQTITVGTDASWSAFAADGYYNPTDAKGGAGLRESGVEFIDAREEQLGWNTVVSMKEGAGWSAAREVRPDVLELIPKMAHPVQLIDVPEQVIVPVQSMNPSGGAPQHTPGSSFYVDFGREFEGGLRLRIKDGTAGMRVQITSAELATAVSSGGGHGYNLTSTWGYTFEWTLRDGEQTLEQHKYMEFRYVKLQFLPAIANSQHTSMTAAHAAARTAVQVPTVFSVSAWRVQAEYVDSDSWFDSDNPTLNHVWELCRYTLEAGVLDTYADSNTRERRPYEADGLIAGSARLMVQRNALMWSRHSHS
jgi:hypothetical protein